MDGGCGPFALIRCTKYHTSLLLPLQSRTLGQLHHGHGRGLSLKHEPFQHLRRKEAMSQSQGVQIRLDAKHISTPSCSLQFVGSSGRFDQCVGIVQVVVDKGLRAGIKC